MTASNDLLGAAIGSGRPAPMRTGQCVRPYPVYHCHSFHESDGLSLKTLLRIRPRDWEAIRERVVSHPHEAIPSSLAATGRRSSVQQSNCSAAIVAATTSSSNFVYTPLHDAIQKNAPSDVVKAIAQAYPPALFVGNGWNRTPLVLACDDCLMKDGIVMALLEEQVKVSQQAHWPTFAEHSGDNFIAGTSQGSNFASWLSYAFPRENGQIHSGPENERAMTFRSNIGRYVPSGGYAQSPNRNDDGTTLGNDTDSPLKFPVSSCLHRFWRLLLLELRAPWVFGHSSSFSSGGELPREVHAVVSAQCPVPVVGLAAHLHPGQLSEENEAGDLPLHIACRQRSASYATTYHRKGDRQPQERRGSAHPHPHKRSRCTRSPELQEYSPTTIDVLVAAHPEAATIPAGDGSMPLHMALAAGNTWRRGGIMSLHNAAPYVLGRRDANSGMFPFMQAACDDGDDPVVADPDDETSESRDLDRVETIFQLLRALPEVLAGEG